MCHVESKDDKRLQISQCTYNSFYKSLGLCSWMYITSTVSSMKGNITEPEPTAFGFRCGGL